MNHNFKTTGLTLTPELRAYAEKRLMHAEKFVQGDTTVHADIELGYSEHNETGKYRAEINLSCGGQIFRVARWGSTMHEAIDIAIGELVGELGRTKEKRQNMLRRSAVKVKEYLRGWRRKV
jgi:ribosomal subunit interface protein